MIKLKCVKCDRIVETNQEEIKANSPEGKFPTCKKCKGEFEEVYNDEAGKICNECEKGKEDLFFFKNLGIKLCKDCIEEVYFEPKEGEI